MALTNKTIASTYGDILQVDNSGSGRTANGTVVKDGLGQSTALTLGGDKAKLTPSSDTTALLTIENAAGTDLLVVDATNTAIKAGTTQSYVNTQIQSFQVFDAQPTADTHHPLHVDGAWETAMTLNDFGTGTDPADTFTISANAERLVLAYWYLPAAITIDEVRVISAGEAADTINFHLKSYTLGTGTGSTAGDLTSGALLAHNGSALVIGADRLTTTTLTIDSASVAADKVVLAFFENVGATTDVTAQLIVKYHYQ